MALIEDFNEKAKQIIQNDSVTPNSEEDETIEIIGFDGVHENDSNLESFVFDGEIMIDNDPDGTIYIPDGDIGIDQSILGNSLIIEDEVTEGILDSDYEISEELKDNLKDDVDYIG